MSKQNDTYMESTTISIEETAALADLHYFISAAAVAQYVKTRATARQRSNHRLTPKKDDGLTAVTRRLGASSFLFALSAQRKEAKEKPLTRVLSASPT